MSKMTQRKGTDPDRGLLFIISAASGTGKTTLAERLVQILPNLRMSRSYTSRPARAGERDGVDYNFVSREHFDGMITRGEFLEWADVFGNLYGTSRLDTERLQASGQDVVLVIDVQGASQVKRSGIDHTAIFILPPSSDELRDRLIKRAQDSSSVVAKRMAEATREMSHWAEYDYVIVNDDVTSASAEITSILTAERLRRKRRIGLTEFVRKLNKTL